MTEKTELERAAVEVMNGVRQAFASAEMAVESLLSLDDDTMDLRTIAAAIEREPLSPLAVALLIIKARSLERAASAAVAAGARHQENRDMKEFAVSWYVERRATMTKDQAAEAIAGKLLPVRFRTVRDWLKGK